MSEAIVAIGVFVIRMYIVISILFHLLLVVSFVSLIMDDFRYSRKINILALILFIIALLMVVGMTAMLVVL